MNRKLTALLLGIALIPAIASAQFRKYSNEFLNIGAGARGLAMGSAQVASVEDGTAGYWNPAGLAGVKEPDACTVFCRYRQLPVCIVGRAYTG